MIKLTPQQFCAQWTNSRGYSTLPSKLESNILNFAISAGKYSKSCFEASFTNQSFYGSGNPWAPRESRWGKKRTHPLLMETGHLLSKIEGEHSINQNKGKKANGERFKRNSASYTIFTLEESQRLAKRSSKKHIGYAAIHNTDPKLHNFYTNGARKRKPVQRQFIGISPSIESYIHANFLPIIFEGFPQ